MSIINNTFDKWVSTTPVMKISIWVILIYVVFSFTDGVDIDGYEYGWTKWHTLFYYGPHFLLGIVIYYYHLASKRLREKEQK